MDFMSFSDSNEQSARSENGVWGLVPRLGFGAAALTFLLPLVRSTLNGNQGAKRYLIVAEHIKTGK